MVTEVDADERDNKLWPASSNISLQPLPWRHESSLFLLHSAKYVPPPLFILLLHF